MGIGDTGMADENTPKTRAEIAHRKAYGRSRITNGSALLPSVDGRSTWARRLRDLVELHLHDLGGRDAVSISAAPIRKLEMPKLAVEANGLVARGATGSNQAGFRQLATELKAMGAPLSDTGVA